MEEKETWAETVSETNNKSIHNKQKARKMKEEMIEGIFGCLERIEEKLDKQPVQTEQDKSEEGSKPMEVLEAMAASQE